ncbi:hypothetical protein GUITHDRAFT_117715 [Guillardia theta CCMP2712]|uniref:Uncharacterized protein n=1 Tax=Guillardia theta (strain CCMP2712) TaxID=905079 RepID=L1IIW0_GUITC|nr:hypothetical protein GUITHDRAFT_117715 [Guillardia theta CCMP2712]EKX36193.1 hypothetical protein GUITHDRAFT_117715 [Guillardia theta CCMP2712]|eukprot:XP_005823173.1 hypothetical protein GUITHDRAFT_117715 [Guillardia theta CCMP2712]
MPDPIVCWSCGHYLGDKCHSLVRSGVTCREMKGKARCNGYAFPGKPPPVEKQDRSALQDHYILSNGRMLFVHVRGEDRIHVPINEPCQEALNRVREVYEWEELDERSSRFQQAARTLNDEITRDVALHPDVNEDQSLEEEEEEEEEDEEEGISEASYDSDYYPGKKGGGFFRYDQNSEESEDDLQGEVVEDDDGGGVEADDDISSVEDMSDRDTVTHEQTMDFSFTDQGSNASSNCEPPVSETSATVSSLTHAGESTDVISISSLDEPITPISMAQPPAENTGQDGSSF